MKAIKLKSIIILSLLLSVNLFAQDFLTGLTYSISIPTGETSNFVSNTSFKGLSIDLRKFFSHNASVGFLLGWSTFEEETNETIDDVEWLDLIGAKITRIREEPLPEPHLVLTLFKMPK